MRLNLWPLALIFENRKVGGKACLFIISVYPNAPRSLIEHELFHVRQNWASLFIGAALLNLTKWGQFQLEAAAFGHELNFVADVPKMAKTYARFLATSAEYKHGRTYDQCLAQIKKKYETGGLI